MPGPGRRAALLMVVATLLWGATFVMIRDALGAIAPLPLVCARFTIASLALAVFLLPRLSALDRSAWIGGALGGALYAAGFVCQAIGLTKTAAGTSAFLTSTGSLLAALFAWPLLGQRPAARLAAGLLLAFVGSALLSPHGALALGAGERWTLLGALAFAFQIVTLARFAPRADALALTAVQSLVLAAVLWPFAGGTVRQVLALRGADIARFAYLVIAGSLIAPLLQVAAQRSLTAGRVGLLFSLEPVFALIFALTIGGERFAGLWWLGAALILGGVALVEWREAGRREGPARRSSA